MKGEFLGGFIVPGKPQILLAPERNAGWTSLRESFGAARRAIEALKPDLLLLYSTQWPSIIGHQIQADPAPKWRLVDQDFQAIKFIGCIELLHHQRSLAVLRNG